ncbi:hypothetical protein FQN60_002822 [Etheostoma spectabile]|uniref:Uncharacterized protein n=1 Tax=Etheostoma spectabile TaxID=54343 RepID=A0A5J5CMP2_9PERO|nr:hypothetical protein FQN60_002822 [Etheostoma spectabile]
MAADYTSPVYGLCIEAGLLQIPWYFILEMHLRRPTCNPGVKKSCNFNSKPKELQCHFTVYYSLEHPSALTESECEEHGY